MFVVIISDNNTKFDLFMMLRNKSVAIVYTKPLKIYRFLGKAIFLCLMSITKIISKNSKIETTLKNIKLLKIDTPFNAIIKNAPENIDDSNAKNTDVKNPSCRKFTILIFLQKPFINMFCYLQDKNILN